MARSKDSSSHRGTMTKLPPIPQGSKVQKRPLIRRQPSRSSKSRIIYVSTGTPFMSAVKRVRKQLDQGLRKSSAAPKNASLQSRVDALERGLASDSGAPQVAVTVVGAGRAVDKTLQVAGWFQQQGDCEVEVRTSTVGTVDDVVDEEEEAEDESRVRRMSCLEVVVKLK